MQVKKRLHGTNICILIIMVILIISIYIDFISCVEIFLKNDISQKNIIEALAYIIGVIRNISLTIVFELLREVLMDIRKNKKPFTILNCKRFRYMAAVILLGELISIYIMCSSSDYIHTTVKLSVDNTDAFLGIICIILGIISEIFHYGYKLQEEIDFIA